MSGEAVDAGLHRCTEEINFSEHEWERE